jgi:hypothetical protein
MIQKPALEAFANHNIVPWDLKTHWSNCLSIVLNIKYSHIFKEGNCCADKLANKGHALID